jgi:transcription initiation factor TFIID subunit TAF12
VKNVVQAVAAACGKQHYTFNTQQQQQQQQPQQLCPATQQGLKHWMQVAQASGVDVPELWSADAAALESILNRAFAADYGKNLEGSTLQHYVRTSREGCCCADKTAQQSILFQRSHGAARL